MKWGERKRSQKTKRTNMRTTLAGFSDSEIRAKAERAELENRYLRAKAEQEQLLSGQNRVVAALKFISSTSDTVNKAADTTSKIVAYANKSRR